jgi:3-hydroxyacyl-[acyl-carrier-protein] dehydratase
MECEQVTIVPEMIDVMRVLPHRYPFLLVDRLEVTETGRVAVGIKRVTGSEWFAQASGSHPVPMPHLLVVEALAQTSAAILAGLLPDSNGTIGYFAAIRRVRCRENANVGDVVTLRVELESFKRGVAKLKGIATVAGRTCVTAEFTTVVRPRE